MCLHCSIKQDRYPRDESQRKTEYILKDEKEQILSTQDLQKGGD
ncbi:hypothetical protein HMPREF9444_01315 [Succinatimonas hippei YIT 12066]|uniref:Uncharacterized protein n=1 Tax=Succinatimonas hippei (strain DSM 22608 / JCM 16073 / KCTC 15190 / YIT 12066) TaxID=762983 RepID=E8LKR8_SUCHY|nr:hypothetical protein HMPREF9444_01315 [Succinatimonas hippei YIT 12066]